MWKIARVRKQTILPGSTVVWCLLGVHSGESRWGHRGQGGVQGCLESISLFHLWVTGVSSSGDRWSETEEGNRTFLLQVLGRWSRTSTGALATWVCQSAGPAQRRIIPTFMYYGKMVMGERGENVHIHSLNVYRLTPQIE